MTTGLVRFQRVNDGKRAKSKDLRQEMTGAERCLWERLRNRKLCRCKFRRQQVIDGFIADFFSEEVRLVIEVDGSIHETDEQRVVDAQKNRAFAARNLSVLRVPNNEVLFSIEIVLNRVADYISHYRSAHM